MGKEIHRVYIALDATEEVVYDAAVQRCDFLLTHHPLLFKGIKQVTGDTSIGRKLYMLIGNDIAAILSCDAFYVCKDSSHSKGCRLEYYAALIYGKLIMKKEDFYIEVEQ